MKRFIVISSILVLFFGVLVPSGSAGTRLKTWTGSRGWGPEAPYVKLYNGKTMENVDGIVTAVQRFIPGRGMSAGVHLLVRAGVEVVDVHLGPQWYIENQDITIQPKDQIEVKGSRVMFRGQPAIIAGEVKKGEDILKLRDDTGFPAWIAWRRH